MRTLTPLVAAGLAALLIQACAHERPAAVSRDILLDSLAADSAGAAMLDDLFAEKHETLMTMLEAREAAGTPDPAALEARSLVAAAEEMYLYGETAVALRLLDDAAAILRRNR